MSWINLEVWWQMDEARRVSVSPCPPQWGSCLLRPPKVFQAYSPQPKSLRLPVSPAWMPWRQTLCSLHLQSQLEVSARWPCCSAFVSDHQEPTWWIGLPCLLGGWWHFAPTNSQSRNKTAVQSCMLSFLRALRCRRKSPDWFIYWSSWAEQRMWTDCK